MQFDDQEEFERVQQKPDESNPFYNNQLAQSSPNKQENSVQVPIQNPDALFSRPKQVVKGIILISKLIHKNKIIGSVLSKLDLEKLDLARQMIKSTHNTERTVKTISKLLLQHFKYDSSKQKQIENSFRYDRYAVPDEQYFNKQLSGKMQQRFISNLQTGLHNYLQLVLIYLIISNHLGVFCRLVQAIDLYPARINKKTFLYQKSKRISKKPKRKIKNKKILQQMEIFQNSLSKSVSLPKQLCPTHLYNIWVQFYTQQGWYPYQPVNMQFKNSSHSPFYTDKLKQLQSVFVLSIQRIRKNIQGRALNNFVLLDRTIFYCQNWPNVQFNRKRLGIKCIFEFNGPQRSSYSYQRKGWKQDQIRSKQIKQSMIPRSQPQMRNSSVFCTVPFLRVNQLLKTNAKPIGLKFKDQDVYFRTDVQLLRTRTGWNQQGRDVILQEQPAKTLIQKRKNRLFYRETQTIPFKIRFNNDGSFVLNQYGNIYDYQHAQIPQQLTFVKRRKFITTVCKKLNIHFAQMVTGFQMDQLMWHPVKTKLLIYKKDKDQLQQNYEKFMQQKESKKAGKMKKELMNLWKSLFRQQKIRRQVMNRYDNQV